MAVEVLRKDIGSDQFFLVDLGLTPRLLKTLNDKAKGKQKVCYLDHHLQSLEQLHLLDNRLEGQVRQGMSAAAVAYEYLGLNGAHSKLAAIADLVEYCPSDRLRELQSEFGANRVEEEARILDFAWRYRVDDDVFRLRAARRLAQGKWPSEVSEVKSRYLQMVNEQRWDKAVERVYERIELKHNVALLQFGRRKPSLFGFGSRALSFVARDLGASVAVMLNRRNSLSSVSLRRTGDDKDGQDLDLGKLVHDFTLEHGIVGGGHPHSAGAKIPTKVVPELLHEIYCFA